MARLPHRCPTLRAILAAMTTPPLPYLTVDSAQHPLDRIEPADANRLRLVFIGPAPELRDRVHYVLVDGANREPVRASSGAAGGRELIVTRVY